MPVVVVNCFIRLLSGVPIVYDFPEDVYPYAIIEHEYPLTNESILGLTNVSKMVF